MGWIHVLWLLITVFGLTNACYNSIDARGDFQRYRKSAIPLQRFMTRIIFQSSLFTVSVHVEFVAASLWSALTDTPPDLRFVVGRIFSSTVLTILAFKGRTWRRRLAIGRYNGDDDGDDADDSPTVTKNATTRPNKSLAVTTTETTTKTSTNHKGERR